MTHTPPSLFWGPFDATLPLHFAMLSPARTDGEDSIFGLARSMAIANSLRALYKCVGKTPYFGMSPPRMQLGDVRPAEGLGSLVKASASLEHPEAVHWVRTMPHWYWLSTVGPDGSSEVWLVASDLPKKDFLFYLNVAHPRYHKWEGKWEQPSRWSRILSFWQLPFWLLWILVVVSLSRCSSS